MAVSYVEQKILKRLVIKGSYAALRQDICPVSLYNKTSSKTPRHARNSLTMVKILPIFLSTLAVMSPMAQVFACTPGLDYCGWVLDKYGGQAWKEKGLRLNGLFHCTSENEAKMFRVCAFSCREGGTGQSDRC